MSLYAEVILDSSLDKPLDYEVPPAFQFQIKKGSRVLVSIRNRPMKGYVICLKNSTEWKNIKPIRDLLPVDSTLPEDLLSLGQWVSSYYHTPFSKVLRLLLPSSLRKDMKAKEQLYVMRAKTKEEIRHYCEEQRGKSLAQVAILDIMLNVVKGCFLPTC